MNWRKPTIYGLLHLTGSDIPKNLEEINDYAKSSKKEVKNKQNRELKKLLLYSWKNVPYYHKTLQATGTVTSNGKVNLNKFSKIPLLTKDVIREEGLNLYSKKHKQRKSYKNTSGGSTGEPVKFIQDKYYNEWNIATKIFFNKQLGKELGEKEIKFWGSDRDILEGTIGFEQKIISFLYNRKFFNSYDLSEEKTKKLIELNNNFKPKCYWSYTDAAFEFAKYAIKNNIKLHSPKFIIVTINPLTEKIRKTIEKAFSCPVYDQYGSREVGPIASEHKQQNGLQTFPWYNHVEILNKSLNQVQTGQEGDIIITNLRNYSMPLIRYKIGDVGLSGGHKTSSNFFVIDKILGRTLGYFVKEDGSLLHSHFLVQALFYKKWIKKFQIIQIDYNQITIKIQKETQSQENKKDMEEINQKTKTLFGKNCQVKFDFVKKITSSKSGKHLYTINQINN